MLYLSSFYVGEVGNHIIEKYKFLITTFIKEIILNAIFSYYEDEIQNKNIIKDIKIRLPRSEINHKTENLIDKEIIEIKEIYSHNLISL